MKQYVVDAFTDKVFAGNPAAVCVLDAWPDDALMQSMARENRLSETAFTVREGDRWRLRWFTPGGEVDLCGHATLATAFVLLNFVEREAQHVEFSTLGGELAVRRAGELYELDFPTYELERLPVSKAMAELVGCEPVAAWLGRDLVLVLPDEAAVRACAPDEHALVAFEPGLLLHVTARADADAFDCVSRSFAPKLNIPEDPVCGSGHCHIVPIWASELGKDDIVAYQASARGGTLFCHMDGERVHMAGAAALYSIADVFVG